MVNNTTGGNQLDETVKETLNSYDANYDSADWSRMERMLDAAPKSSASNLPYGRIAIIGAAVLLGSFLVYKGINSSGSDTAETPIPAEENKTEEVIATPPPAITNTVPAVSNPPAETIPEKKPAPGIVTVPAENIPKETPVAIKKKKTDTSDAEKNHKVSVMGNEPVFGDMIDSSKGIIHETKEKESTKKAAKSKGTSGVGLNGLFFNLDSIRKQKEQMKNDSLR